MPHVSHKDLDKKTFDKIFHKFINTLEKAQSKGKLSLVLNELLTDTEKIMFAKRVAVVFMLANHIPYHKISEVLNVSPTTVTKISLGVEVGKYDSLISISTSERLDMEKIVWAMLTAGGLMPPIAGRKRWRKKII